MSTANEWLAVIPSRGGSRGIPEKNVRSFLGKPLLVWTLEAARDSGVLQRILLSTDDEGTATIARASGFDVPFLRPASLAQDITPTAPVIRHAVEWLQKNRNWRPDFVMVLEPTSPGRQPFHIHEAAELLVNSGADTVASITEVPHHFSPAKVFDLREDGRIIGVGGTHPRNMVHRRQDLPTHYAFDGLIFACKTELVLSNPPTLWGKEVLGYVVDPKYAVDLDRPEDWAPAEAKLKTILLGDD